MTNMSSRDRKILLAIVPIVCLLAYWFLLLSPQRQEAAKAGEELAKQEKQRDELKSQVTKLEASKSNFAADYVQLVRLGKAVPTKVDMPSLIVQLDAAARGTGIEFNKIKTGERTTAPASTPPAGAPGAEGAQPGSGTPASGEGAAPQSSAGQNAAKANNAADTANQRSSSAEQSGVTPQDTQTSTTAGQGGAAATGSGAPGLESVPLEFQFDGSFFDLADFFHKLKRFVHVANDDLKVRGRLLTIDNLTFSSDPKAFPSLKADVKATVWLAPKAEGATAGAGPAGPQATPASAPTAPGAGEDAAATPTATATP